jgi:hypothetical protein
MSFGAWVVGGYLSLQSLRNGCLFHDFGIVGNPHLGMCW